MTDVGHRGELRLLDRVEQREADLDPAVAERPHRSDDDRVGAARAEVAELARPRRGPAAATIPASLDQPEQAAALQIGADDAGDAERPVRLVLERDDRDGDRRAGAADDLDGELRAGGRDGQDQRRRGRRRSGGASRSFAKGVGVRGEALPGTAAGDVRPVVEAARVNPGVPAVGL